MSGFDYVGIIYNPNSTGPSQDKAEQFHRRVRELLPDVPADLVPTEYAGHATELAREMAKHNRSPLIVSSSGDGGYHETINGALEAQTSEDANPTCAVLPAGNANDHRNAVGDGPLWESLRDDDITRIDVLKATITTSEGTTTTRFAHSYIGIGLTPAVAVELNRASLGRVKETLIVLRALREFQPVIIEVGNERLVVDSIIFTNISRMAKYLTIAEDADPDDGRFEIIKFPHKHKPQLLWRLLKAAVSGLKGTSASSYSFTATKHMVLQCDGEVVELNKGDVVDVTLVPKLLRTLL